MRNIYLKIFYLFLFTLLVSPKGYCQHFDPKENAVYIYNFVKYTSWPKKKTSIQVGIVGATSLDEELKNLFSRKANSGTSYTVHRITPAEAKNMDVVIVAASAADELKTIGKETAHLPVLIISERENMSRMGACICFYIDDDNDYKTGYQLSLRNCTDRGLRMNEQIINNAVLTR